MSDRLEELPVKNGFRIRGMAMTRIETFTDAAFAFALTLLIVSLDMPTNYAELISVLREVPAFALSAVLLMVFWAGHHTWSQRYGLEDALAIVLSCLLVFTVLVYVYPLKFLFSSSIAWLTYALGVPITSDLVSLSPLNVNSLFVIYGVGYVAMCATVVLLNLHAWRVRDALQLNELERYDTKAEIWAWIIVGSAGLLSILIALATPPSFAGLPGWAYMLLGFIMPIYGVRSGRRRRVIIAATNRGSAS